MTSSFRRSLAVSILVLVGMGSPAASQSKKTSSGEASSAAPALTADHLKGLELRNIGPAIMGGRIDDFAVVEGNPSTFYVGTASGGILKTTNNGTTFEPVFDAELVSSIGDLTLAPSDPQVLYVGTGEPNNRQSSSWGNGVYRTLDGGKTWQHLGLAETHHIGRIVVHPRDPDVVYVAALGRLWGPNRERGLYKTTDGGRSWTNTKFVDEDTGFVDVAMDPQSPDTLYAASYQRRRTPLGLQRRRPRQRALEDDRRRSELDEADEGPARGRAGAHRHRRLPRDPNIVYALVEHAKEGGIYRSDDKGESLEQAVRRPTRGRPTTARSTSTPTTTSASGCWARRCSTSEDGGRTFKTDVVDKIHGDYHAMWINPRELGPHAGRQRRRHPPELRPRPQLGLREHGAARAVLRGGARQPAAVPRLRRAAGQRQLVGAVPHVLPAGHRATTTGCASAAATASTPCSTRPTPTSSTSRARTATCSACTARAGERRLIRPEPTDSGERYRFNWNSPVLVSPHDAKTIYYGGNRLFGSQRPRRQLDDRTRPT